MEVLLASVILAVLRRFSDGLLQGRKFKMHEGHFCLLAASFGGPMIRTAGILVGGDTLWRFRAAIGEAMCE